MFGCKSDKIKELSIEWVSVRLFLFHLIAVSVNCDTFWPLFYCYMLHWAKKRQSWILFETFTRWTIDGIGVLWNVAALPPCFPTTAKDDVISGTILIASRRYCSKESQGELWIALKSWYVLPFFEFSATVSTLPHFPPIIVHEDFALDRTFLASRRYCSKQ